jgi:glutathione S-transferase
MKLFYSPTSPFARKVRVTAEELGLTARVELIAIDPWTDPSLRAINPLGKVPGLTTDEGEILYDSPVICEYLDALVGGGLVPPSGPARWTARRREALADGVCDAAVLRLLEGRRGEHDQHQDMIDRWSLAIVSALDAAEEAAPGRGEVFDLGQIALACMLGYLDFRAPYQNWRHGRPALQAWYAEAGQRPSMLMTVPPGFQPPTA